MAVLATGPIAPTVTQPTHRVARWFYISVALVMVLLNVIAFGPSMIDPSRRNAPLPLTPLLTAHAVVSALWLLLFLAQATLVATRNTAVHRRVGIAGGILTVMFVLVGSLTVIEQARRGFDLSGDLGRLPPPPGVADVAPVTLLLLFNFLTFALLVGGGLWYRHRPSVHKRLMLLAMLGALPPTAVAHLIGHWLGPRPWAAAIFPVSAIAFMSVSAIYDRVSHGRIHPLSVWVPILLVTWHEVVLNFVVVQSAPWREFAVWLIR
jgi:uncharacterized membrane protein YozB (DUF420 family)